MIEFTSERKLMSVVVRDASGQLFVFAKGSEAQIIERLTEESAASELRQAIEAKVFDFGGKGLRTLVFAMRTMSEEEFAEINWEQASAEELSADIEKNLEIIGCTGAEDELQEEVSECIEDFKQAGIKIWMLTGDLGHTAKEIGFKCGILSRDLQDVNYTLDAITKEEVQEKVKELSLLIAESKQMGRKTGVMLSGQAFQVAMSLDDFFLTKLKREILLEADSVIIYRSSPKQKSVAVELVMSELKNKKVTLAIGDGFNDVNMIQTAHIGIGVQGKESNQAAVFADYAIVKFKDLRRLMFWHGRGFTHKGIFFILLTYYKVWPRIWQTLMLNSFNGMSAMADH